MADEKIILVRPIAMDAREYRDLINEALNRLNVHVGEHFELRAVARSTRPRIPIDKKTKRPAQDPDRMDETPTTAELFDTVVDG